MFTSWEERYTIRAYEADEQNKARLSSLWDILQDAASSHAAELGFDYQTLYEKGIFWMLCRMRLEIHRYPKMGEKILVKTISGGVDKIFAIRDYFIYDELQNKIAQGRSCWIIANRQTLKPEKIQKHIPQLHFPAQGDLPGKILVTGTPQNKYSVTVSYSDIDVNHHVNNGRYIHWIENTMDAAGLDPHPTWIQVNFIAEEKKGAEIEILPYHADDKFYYEMKNQEGKLILQAQGA